MSYAKGLNTDGFDYYVSPTGRVVVEDCQVIRGVAMYGEANLNGELQPYDQSFDRARKFDEALKDQRFSGFHL